MTRAIWIDFLKEKQKEQEKFIKEQEKFIDEVCKIAFGDSAKCVPFLTGKPREVTKEEILKRLRGLETTL